MEAVRDKLDRSKRLMPHPDRAPDPDPDNTRYYEPDDDTDEDEKREQDYWDRGDYHGDLDRDERG